jgi:hypothetical protein
MIGSVFRPLRAIESEFSEMSETMVKTPKEPPITNKPLVVKLGHDVALTDINTLAELAQSAPGLKSGECMKKTWERIDRYWSMLEQEPTELSWSNERVKEDKAELLRRLIENRDNARISARFIYQAAIDHLKRKSELPRGQRPNSIIEGPQNN